jgi:hypothetical protein
MSSTIEASAVFEVPEIRSKEPRIVLENSLPVLAYAKDSSASVARRYTKFLATIGFLIACVSLGPNILKIYAEGFSLLLLDSGQRWVARAWGEGAAYCYAIVLTSLTAVLLIGSIGLFFLREWARRLLLVYSVLALLTYGAAAISGLFVVVHSYRGETEGVLGLSVAVGLVCEDLVVRSMFPALMFFMLRFEAVQQLFHHHRGQTPV